MTRHYLNEKWYLIQKGVGVNLNNFEGITPIFYASHQGHLDVVECLIQNRAIPNIKLRSPNNEMTPLKVAERKGHANIVHFLIQNGALHPHFG